MPDEGRQASYDALLAAASAASVSVLDRPASLAGNRLLSVDGPSGSGKTTFARLVAQLLTERGIGVGLLSLDDMYDGWAGLDAALEQRVLHQVLEPLSSGRAARWQAYDWARRRFGRWHELAPSDVLVLEGCGAGAQVFAPYTTLLVWVEAAADVRAARVVARDGAVIVDHWAAWAASEERSFARNAPRPRADLTVRT